ISQINDGQFWVNAGLAGTQSSNLSDPRVVYDPQSQRWFATEITVNQSTNNRILIARSNSADPGAGWKAATLTLNNGEFGDFPTLGLNATGLAIATIGFTASGAGTGHVALYSIPKADLTATNPTLANLTRFNTLNQSAVGNTLQPVNDF